MATLRATQYRFTAAVGWTAACTALCAALAVPLSGVRAATPSIQRATTNGQEVQHRIDAVIAELQRVANAMTPAVSQPASNEVLAPGYAAPAGAAQGNK